jgi:hypothetical protein
MKKIIIPILLLVAFLQACEKNNINADKSVITQQPTGRSNVKFFHGYNGLTPSLAATANGPSVDIYVNNEKVNGAAITYSTVFPLSSGAYLDAPAGSVNIKVILSRINSLPVSTDTLLNQNITLNANGHHSVFLTESTTATGAGIGLTVLTDNISIPEYGRFRVRFVNTVPTTEQIELYNTTTRGIYGLPILFKGNSDYFDLPLQNGSNTFAARLPGAATNIATAVFSTANQRIYTLWYRGHPTIAGRTRSLVSVLQY